MPDPSMLARIKRLLNDDFHQDDLTRLFLYVREHCDSRESVKEIGDFVAHQRERYKGIVTQSVRDWYTTTQFLLPSITQKLGESGRKFDLGCLPANTTSFLYAAYRRLDQETIRKHTGISKSNAKTHLDSIIRKFGKKSNGTLFVDQTPTRKEFSVLECLLSYLVAKPAFTNDTLFDDLKETLRSLDLIKKGDLRKFESMKNLIGLYAISVMHNCVIKIDSVTILKLKTQIRRDENSIHIYVGSPIDGVEFASTMFVTECDIDANCDKMILMEMSLEEFTLEIKSDRTLGVI